MRFLSSSVLLLLCSSSSMAQNTANTMLGYLDEPVQAWTRSIGARVETEVALSPTGDFLVVAGNDCSMTAINLDGTQKWQYTSPAATEDCIGGILFGTAPSGIAYAARAVPNDGGFDSQIVAIDTTDGMSTVYSIGPIPGIVSGTPRITEDQQYLVLTSNTENFSRGHFTIWNVATGQSIFQFDTPNNSTDPLPFGPVGFEHSPIQGYYVGGFDNPNDIFVWGIDNELTNPAAGSGQVYAFQFPATGADAVNATLGVTLVGSTRGFQTPTEPVFANDGLSMYWTVTRNELRCWVGQENEGRNSIDKRPQEIDIPNADLRSDTGMAPPVVTDNAVFGPMAGNLIFRTDLSCQSESLILVNTPAAVNTKILPSSDGMFVFYATVEPDSKLYMLNSETMEQVWEYQLNRGVEADMTLSPDGSTLFVVSAGGVLEAVTVAGLVAAPTEAPTLAPIPTSGPTTSPMPTTSPTGSPMPSMSPEPTISSTMSPTLSPVTDFPTKSPTVKTVTDDGTGTTSAAVAHSTLVVLAIYLFAALI